MLLAVRKFLDSNVPFTLKMYYDARHAFNDPNYSRTSRLYTELIPL